MKVLLCEVRYYVFRLQKGDMQAADQEILFLGMSVYLSSATKWELLILISPDSRAKREFGQSLVAEYALTTYRV